LKKRVFDLLEPVILMVENWFPTAGGKLRKILEPPVVVPPPPPPPPDPLPAEGLPPIRPVPPRAAADGHPVLRVCIDLGTHNSAVAIETASGPRFAVLGINDDGERTYQIGSTVWWYSSPDAPGRELPIMGQENIQLHSPPPGAQITTSFKRILFEYEWFQSIRDSRSRLVAMFRELLLLALAPEKSSTISTSLRLLAKDEALVPASGGPYARLQKWSEDGGVGFPHAELAERLQNTHLRLCVPNAFDAFAIQIALDSLHQAFREMLTAGGFIEGYAGDRNVELSVIRESEAVTWTLAQLPQDQQVMPQELALVLDIGAGTADAALVRFDLDKRPRLELRTGIPFGGNDVDQLLLCIAQQTRGNDALPVDEYTIEMKTRDLITIRREKEEWSRRRNSSLSRAEVGKILEHFEGAAQGTEPPVSPAAAEGQPASSSPEQRSMTLPARVRGSTAVGAGERVEVPLLTTHPRYARFLRFAVLATCKPLFEYAQRNNAKIAHVLLSGAASYTPGVSDIVKHLARLTDRVPNEQKIVFAGDLLANNAAFDGLRNDHRAKLVCVWGGTYSMADHDANSRTVDKLPEAYRVKWRLGMGGEERDLFAAGSELYEQRADALFTLPRPGHPYTLQFYRYFCPPDYIDERDRDSRWVRVYVGETHLDASTDRVAMQLSHRGETGGVQKPVLSVWAQDTRPDSPFQKRPVQPPAFVLRDTGRSPVTGLPLDWPWSGAASERGARSQ
jgi:hypothetical protein